MKTALGVAVVFGVIGAGSAFSQSGAGTTPAANPPVVSATSSDPRPADAPVAGANSFTETQARSRIEAHGYANVSKLTKDDNSIWRGKATKGGAPVSVALDYQGKIFPGR
jgi:putative membrane protein